MDQETKDRIQAKAQRVRDLRDAQHAFGKRQRDAKARLDAAEGADRAIQAKGGRSTSLLKVRAARLNLAKARAARTADQMGGRPRSLLSKTSAQRQAAHRVRLGS